LAKKINVDHDGFCSTSNRYFVHFIFLKMTKLNAIGDSNRFVELTFESSINYQVPFSEVTLDAIFTEPSGNTCCIPAFWAGGNIWRIRYSSSALGTHSFITKCSDNNNESLHGRNGTVEVLAYQGDNVLFRHGALRVANDKRHFSHADGTPFFWLGDTWWMGLTKRLSWPDEFKQLTQDRKSKGFSVVQIVAGLYPDMPAFDERGASESGFPWEQNYSSINPRFFDEADQRIMHLVEQGIVPCILGAWGYYLLWLGTEKMKLHWRYLVARWGALPVVWSAAGEQAMPWYLSGKKETDSQQLKQEWSEIIRYIREVDGFGRLLTTHPQKSARESVDDPSLIDFEMQQTGHRNPTKHHAERALEGWNGLPIMPVVDAESRYEALDIFPSVSSKDTREAFWAHMLNSGCAGHTYGANGIWQVNKIKTPFGKSPGGHDWGSISWDVAVNLPASTQLAIAKKFLLSLPWYALENLEIKVDLKTKTMRLLFAPLTYQTPIAAARLHDNSLTLYYLQSLKPIYIEMAYFPNPVSAKWFDPTSSAEIPAYNMPIPNTGRTKFTPPSKNGSGDNDWVLVLQVI
jgi:hypothetical protein